MRGHEVIVLEQANRVGGQIWVGAASPLRRSWSRIAEYYDRQSRKQIYDVRLNTRATREEITALNPDVVIIATGSVPNRHEIPGGKLALTVHDLVENGPGKAKRAIVFDTEGFNRAFVAADLLSSLGIHVEFVTPFETVGHKIEGMMIDELVHQLVDRDVRFRPGHDLLGWVGNNDILIRNPVTNEEHVLPEIDLVVALVGSTAVCSLVDDLRNYPTVLYVIGDALSPQTVEEATFMGASLGRSL